MKWQEGLRRVVELVRLAHVVMLVVGLLLGVLCHGLLVASQVDDLVAKHCGS